MTRAEARTQTRATFPSIANIGVVVLALFVGIVPIAGASVEKANPAHPRVTDGLMILDAEDLSSQAAPFLSGLRDNSLVTSYEGTDGELLNCTDAFVEYTLDGSLPVDSPLRAPLTCDAVLPLPALQQTYRGALPANVLKESGLGATIRFRIHVLVLPNTFHIDDNHGEFFTYNLDTTAPRVTGWSPTGSSTMPPWGASADGRPPLSFVVEDDPLQGALAPTTTVTIDGKPSTDRFRCEDLTPHRRACTFDYPRAGKDFTWSAGEHRIIVGGSDVTGNPVNATTSAFVLRIDRTAPTIQNIQASPSVIVSTARADIPTTARGVPVTVEAKIDDPSLDAADVERVFAQLVSEDGGLVSGHVPMTSSDNGVWRTDELTIPADWPAAPIEVRARVSAADRAGNIGRGESPKPLFRLDPEPPAIFIVDPPTTVGAAGLRVRALVSDRGSGVDESSVRVRYTTIGDAPAEPDPFEPAVEAYREIRLAAGKDGVYQGVVPASRDGSVIGYYVVAKDKAGGESQTETFLVDVDALAPTIIEVDRAPFRGQGRETFKVTAADNGSGLDPTSVNLHVRIGGIFRDAPMSLGPGGVFQGSMDLQAPDGQWVSYYIDASDRAGNVGRLGQPSAPMSFRLDAVAPVVTVDAPETTDGSPFIVSWRGIDEGSGVDGYVVEARVENGPWYPLAIGPQTSAILCPAGPETIEFRAAATDRAGNKGSWPSAPQAVTRVEEGGCSQRIAVEGVSVGSDRILNASRDDHGVLTWSATSIEDAVPDDSLRIDIDFSPDAGAHYFPFRHGLANEGRYSFRVSSLDECGACRFKVSASGFTGSVANGESSLFTVEGGDRRLDRDGNGLPDAWELRYANVGHLQAADDLEPDGLSNAEEALADSNPFLADTDGDGASDALEYSRGTSPIVAASLPLEEQVKLKPFSRIYWIVPPTFAVLLVVYIIGLSRNW